MRKIQRMPLENLDNLLKILALVGAVGSFGVGLWQWTVKEDKDRQQRKDEYTKSEENRRLEATKPFLERQLKLYTEVSQVAAKIATQESAETSGEIQSRFWALYWGELALVENESVEAAMKKMGDAIKDKCPKHYLEQKSLELAHAMRASLDRSWGINAWASPDTASSRDLDKRVFHEPPGASQTGPSKSVGILTGVLESKFGKYQVIKCELPAFEFLKDDPSPSPTSAPTPTPTPILTPATKD
ncbi:hypothetical protein PS918_03149 [Pseudomonas fluorescens]|uniref:Uncharacterized protein n=1 Tax=Pseudomonas fluorescens TaxID=294 RepID=A0A5E7STQ0_PSEFL|nr:hypothetical protein [Pseudomonas fluorescens]VVP90102.1 hypothetical protein PS918_03149 [Pseudomonas fluorescens]